MADFRTTPLEIYALVFHFLKESGFDNSACTFAKEAELDRYDIDWHRIPSRSLKSFVEEAIRRAFNELKRPTRANSRTNMRKINLQASLLEIHRYLKHDIAIHEDAESISNQEHNIRMDDDSEMKADPSHRREEEDGVIEHAFTANEPELHKCAWNPVFPILVTGSTGPNTRLWRFSGANSDVNTRKSTETPMESILLRNQGERNKDALSLDWNPQGNTLAIGTQNGSMGLWTRTGRIMQNFQLHESPVSVLKWSKKGKFLLSGSLDGTGVVLDPVTKSQTKFRYLQESCGILDADWLDDWTFASCAADKMFIWCINREFPMRVCEDHKSEVNCVRFHPTLKIISTCSDDKTAKIWDARSARVLQTLGGEGGHGAQVSKLQWSPQTNEKNMLATCSFDNTVKLWDVISANCMQTLRGHTSSVFTLEYSPDGRFIASGSQDGTMFVWSTKDGTKLHRSRHDGSLFDLSWSPDGMHLSAVFNGGTFLLLDTRNNLWSSTMSTESVRMVLN